MGEHVRALGIIGIVRSAIALTFGLWLLAKAQSLEPSDYGIPLPSMETLLADQLTFRIVGIAMLVLAPVWAVQAILALTRKPLARRFGTGIALFDLVNLVFFPLSTALGLYGLVVYHHPDTALHLRDLRPRIPRP